MQELVALTGISAASLGAFFGLRKFDFGTKDDVNQTVVTTLIIAGILAAMEAVVFYKVIINDIRGQIEGSLKKLQGELPKMDPQSREAAKMITSLAAKREKRVTEEHNQTGFVLSLMIAFVPLVVALTILLLQPNLRKGDSRKQILFSVVFVVLCIAAFQLRFYFFGQKYNYSGRNVLLHEVCKTYVDI